MQKTSPAFDAGVWEFFWPLCTGRPLVLASADCQTNPDRLVETIEAKNVAAVQFVPATLQLFLDSLSPGDCPDLRQVFCGGGELTAELVARVHAALPQVQLSNFYGPTEACVDCTYAVMERGKTPPIIPIGKPISNTRIYILDTWMNPVPIGVSGEIYIGGRGVARGYLNQPELTRERFVDSPFVTGDRLYRSGDTGRFRTDGTIEFSGRADFQLKIRGYRIEPGEIEACLLESGAREAVVVAVSDRLVAYISGDTAIENLQSNLRENLPEYMIPAVIIPLGTLPLLSNGKINRAALPAPDIGPMVVNQASPRDHIELTLYNIWKSVLLHPVIGINDSFFDLGGTSISAIKMVHLIKGEFGVDLPLRTVISHPTIEALGGWLRAAAKGETPEQGLISFRAGTKKCNVVCVHPAGGTAFCYLSLAKKLPEFYGVHGLQSPGLNAGEALSENVEAMAKTYLKLIETMTDAPLVITGLSFGGLIAHEMGRRLSEAGKSDVSVVLLDTQGTDNKAYRQEIDTVEMDEFREKLIRFNGTYPGIEDAQIARYFSVYNHNRLAVRDYDVPESHARTVFVQARSDLPRWVLHETRRYWKSRTDGGYKVRLVRGDHWDMLETEELTRVREIIMDEIALFTNGERSK